MIIVVKRQDRTKWHFGARVALGFIFHLVGEAQTANQKSEVDRPHRSGAQGQSSQQNHQQLRVRAGAQHWAQHVTGIRPFNLHRETVSEAGASTLIYRWHRTPASLPAADLENRRAPRARPSKTFCRWRVKIETKMYSGACGTCRREHPDEMSHMQSSTARVTGDRMGVCPRRRVWDVI